MQTFIKQKSHNLINITISNAGAFFSSVHQFSVPPHQILVYDASGRDVSGSIGPMYEGDNLVLSCEVRGGK